MNQTDFPMRTKSLLLSGSSRILEWRQMSEKAELQTEPYKRAGYLRQPAAQA